MIKEINDLKSSISDIKELKNEIEENLELLKLSEEYNDEDSIKQVQLFVESLNEKVKLLRIMPFSITL